jgi:hypothetical protein
MSWYLLYIIIDDEIKVVKIIYRRFFNGKIKIYGERTEINSP